MSYWGVKLATADASFFVITFLAVDEGSVWILLCSTHRCSGCRLIGDDQ